MLAAIGESGSMAGRVCPITPESVLIRGLAEAQGITGYETNTLIYATITTIVLSVVIFLVFKGYKVKGAEGRVQEQLSAFTQKDVYKRQTWTCSEAIRTWRGERLFPVAAGSVHWNWNVGSRRTPES